LLIAAGLMIGCADKGSNSNVQRSVEVAEPQKVENEIVNSYPGIVQSQGIVNVAFKTAGQLSKIYVKEGDKVRKEQLVAQLDTKDYNLGLSNAEIQYNQFKNEFERIKELYKSGDVSQNDYEKAEAGIKRLEIQLQNNKNTIEYTSLRAPFEGIVMGVNYKENEMVDAGTPMISLMDVSKMEILVDLPNCDYLQRGEFKAYKCAISSEPNEYDLQLISIMPKADGNQLYQMRLTFSNKPTSITAGQNVVVRIFRENGNAKTNAVKIPIHSIFDHEGQKCVWKLNADSSITRTVITSNEIDSKGNAIVTEGIGLGDKIVRAGSASLVDGEKVHVLPVSAKTNIGNIL